MPMHIKRDGETMSMFLHRISAWNNGEPVPSDKPPPESEHKFEKHYIFCKSGGCFASHETRHSYNCPQGVGWRAFGFFGVPKITI